MPIEFLGTVFLEGTHRIPYWEQIKTLSLPVLAGIVLKLYTSGSTNTWERTLHGKVYIVTGGTSGIGAAVVRDLASKGAQLVLLTSAIGENADQSARVWMTDYVDDLREATSNQLIYTEYCDLSDLYSIRKFATKWLDSKPARRLDGVICCAGECLPAGKMRSNTVDGVESQMAINYLGHYHLLTLLEPSLRVQPPDRDVRVLVSSCLSQSFSEVNLSDILWEDRKYPIRAPWKVYGTSKMMLTMFAKEFQRRIESKERPDKQPCNVRVNIVNPGIARTPSTRRFLSMGSVFGLLLYVFLWPLFWLFLKSAEQGAQSHLFAIYSPNLEKFRGGNYIKECAIVKEAPKTELTDEKLQAELFDETEKLVKELEKTGAIERNKRKPEKTPEGKVAAEGTGNNSNNNEAAAIKDQLFTSAFSNSGSLYPDLSKAHEPDAAKDIRLRRLDEKFQKRKQ